MCTICFSNDSNCIILNCKHSAVCRDCAMDMVKKTNICPFCRMPIEKVCVVKADETGKLEVLEEFAKQ